MTIAFAPPLPFLATNDSHADLFPVASELTVAQAAKFLRSSEGYVTELLDDGLIEFRQESGQRLVQWNSLRDFEQERESGYQSLEKIVHWSHELGLYDDD